MGKELQSPVPPYRNMLWDVSHGTFRFRILLTAAAMANGRLSTPNATAVTHTIFGFCSLRIPPAGMGEHQLAGSAQQLRKDQRRTCPQR